MLSSIHPFGERSRNSRWWSTVAAYVAASALAGAVLGTLAGLVGQLLATLVSPTAALVVFGMAAVVVVSVDAGLLPVPMRGWHRQVNEVWLTTYRGWVYGAGFGFQLGLGIATIVTTATVWLTWLTAVLVGSWWQGLVIGLAFGTMRGSLILATGVVDDPTELRRLHRRLAATAAPIRRATVALTGFVAIVALTTTVV